MFGRLLGNQYDAVVFDVGNTLVRQANPGTPASDVRAEVLDGVREAIDSLRGHVRMGVVSNTTTMSEVVLREHLRSIGLEDAFEVVIATADVGVHKPDPLPLVMATKRLGIGAAKALYVGDSEVDEIAAARAGLAFCYTGPNLMNALERHLTHSESAWQRALMSPRRPQQGYAQQVQDRFESLVKPSGSLGLLEHIVGRIASIQHTSAPTADPCGIIVFCADHGIAVDDTVTPWPQEISATMAETIAKGRAVSSSFARAADVYLEVVDVGLARKVEHAGVRDHAVRRGTFDMRAGIVMSHDDVVAALEVGARSAERIVAGGSRLLCVGEVGMGNTTIAAAIISKFTGLDPHVATGRGTGIDDPTLVRKRAVVDRAAQSVAGCDDPLEIAARIGGLEVVAMTGFLFAAARLGVPVLLDGVITQAAACLAMAFDPEIKESFIAGHRSAEPASVAALAHLQLQPLLALDLRLGEGTGALLAVPLLRAGCATLHDVAQLSEVI